MKRRTVLKTLASLLGISTTFFSYLAIRVSSEFSKTYIPPIPINSLKQRVNFRDGLIIVKDHEDISVFSSKCTHLGCEINKFEGDEIICPCHGSRYNLLGEVVKGPSDKALTKIDFKIYNEEINIKG